jgi:hypothetical protein
MSGVITGNHFCDKKINSKADFSNKAGDLGSTLGPLVALPLVAEVGFAVEYLACVGLAACAAVLVIGTLLGGDSMADPGLRPTRADDD